MGDYEIFFTGNLFFDSARALDRAALYRKKD
jgi:hypothetical protein